MAGLLVATITLIFTLVSLTDPAISQALIDGTCSTVTTLAVKYDKSLVGHVLTSYPVEKEDDCQLKCFQHRLCVSYNLGPVAENDFRDCEISKSDEFRDPQNMTVRPGYFYRGTKNSCSSGPCPQNASCIPYFEGDFFQCECPAGFTGDTCAIDIDECLQHLDDCHYNSSCNNTVGSYQCHCNEGFTGNGRVCVDIDECQQETHNCSQNGYCNNTAGSYVCVCNIGFFGDGRICKECQTPLGMESRAITDGQIIASSVVDDNHAASHARLHYQGNKMLTGGWAAAQNNENQWLQIDMESQYTRLTLLATQGAHDDGGPPEWVVSFQLQSSSDGMFFHYYKERGHYGHKTFDGNSDQDTVVNHYLNPPIRARYIRFLPTDWYNHISMRVELYGCRDCQDALGVENGAIPDGQITASSLYSRYHSAHQGRLNFQANGNVTGAWSAKTNDVDQWLQIDLGVERTVTRVATQGRTDRECWVAKYFIEYKPADSAQQSRSYTEHVQGQEVIKEFSGNTDQNTVVYHYLNPPIRARYIRFRPVDWHRHISMRVELYGCLDIDECLTGEHRCDLKASCNNTIGSYKCTCDWPYQGNGFTCQGPVPPTFRLVPMSIAVEEQQNVTFKCSAYGLPLPVITWSKVGESLPVNRAVSSQWSLHLLDVLQKDSGNYTCTASNLAGNITSKAELEVYLILKFTVLPPLGPIYIFAGDSLTLPCFANSDLVPTLRWHMAYSGGIEVFSDNTLFISSAVLEHSGSYVCTANNSFRTLKVSIKLSVYFLPSCRDIKSRQLNSSGNIEVDTSGYYFIDPDGGDTGESPFKVFCNMTMYGNNSVTVISHDSEDRTLVTGYEKRGSYSRKVSYEPATLNQIANLVSVSVECFQFIKFECYEAAMFKGDFAWWVSRDQDKMNYWGGAVPNSQSCACANDHSCVDKSFLCNCDSERSEWLEDSGFLSDKSTLPVTELRFGDTGQENEQGYHTLGKLMCIGEAMHIPSPITDSAPVDTMTATIATEVTPSITTSASRDIIMATIATEVTPTITTSATEVTSTITTSASGDTMRATVATEVTPTITTSASGDTMGATVATEVTSTITTSASGDTMGATVATEVTPTITTFAPADGMTQFSTSTSTESMTVATAPLSTEEMILTTSVSTDSTSTSTSVPVITTTVSKTTTTTRVKNVAGFA